MRIKRKLSYWICLNGEFWWANKKLDDPAFASVSKSNMLYCRTKKQAFKYLNRCPKGTTVTRMLSRRAGRFMQAEWEK